MRKRYLSILLAAAPVLSGCNPTTHEAAAQSPAAPAPPTAVQTTQPVKRDVSRPLTVPADVLPMEETTIYAKVPGYLDKITVDKGDRVAAGQLLAVIRAPELEADRRQAEQSFESAVQSSQASLAAGQRSAEEQKRAQINAEKVKADYAQAPAAVKKSQAQLAGAKGALERARQGKSVADAALQESRAQLQKAAADMQSADADQRLADITFDRYNGIYTKDSKLIARQQVDEAEARARAARGKTDSARAQVEAARLRIQSAQAQVEVAQQQIVEAEAGVEAAKAQVNISQAQMNSLFRQVEMANRDIDISKRSLDVAGAQARQARLAAESQRSAAGKSVAMADYARLRAPFAGIVTKRQVDPGAFIQTASASQNAQPILTLANIDRLRIYMHVPESESRYAQPGTPVQLNFLSLPDEPLKAKVARTSSSLDPKTRTLLAEVDLPNPGHRLLPGSYATAKIALETHTGVIALPKDGVGVEKTGKFAMVVDGGKAKRLPITTGFDDGAWVEITDGLRGTEEVIVTGRDNLSPGGKVTTSPWVPKNKAKAP